MKRIGILTYHYPESRNYGAILQAYSTLTFLKGLGYDTKIIDYKKMKKEEREKLKEESKNFQEFSDKFLELTELCETKKELKKLNDKIDIFLVGSDQVWRAGKLRFSPEYFFNFVEKNKRKISYAASFGLNKWNGNILSTFIVKKLIKKFDFISVREESGKDICKDIFGVESSCVLDPTLILPKENYYKIIETCTRSIELENNYIAYMILDENSLVKEYSEKIANDLNCNLKHIKGEKSRGNIFKYSKVEEWLSYIKNAELVITDSFHCVAFSIIFNKKFIVLANPARGIARLENLLKLVGLENRLFVKIEDIFRNKILTENIDYEEVEKKLSVHREYSVNFLKKALGEKNA